MQCIDVIIETPKGTGQKYDYDRDFQLFKLRKILPSGMVFPYDFGFIPGTKGEDGDPLDVLVISEFSTFPGCLLDCRIIGGFKALQSVKSGKDKMIRNDRFFAIPDVSMEFEKIRSIADLPDRIVKDVEAFFIDYNKLEQKKFQVLSVVKPKKAINTILKQIE
jgi:inorganic pyrophosphatase